MGFLTSHYNNNYTNSYPSHQSLQTFDNSETITFQHHHEQQQQHQQNYDFSSSFLDETLFFPNPCNFYSNENNYYYPCEDQLIIDSTFSCDQNDGFVSMNDIFPNDENLNNYVNNLPCPKRQKLGYDETLTNHHHQQQQQELLNSANYFVDEFIGNPFSTTTLFEPEAELEAFSCSNVVDVVQCEKKVGGERTISTQSIAARERRRKITEKTQELGKLVPGGPKMNTAEMLSAAANYVRFLQAQVGMLQVMETFSKEEKEPPPTSEDLHKLVVSPFVQEKLYSEEKCFISKGIITTLANNVEVRSKPSILQGLKQLVGKEIDDEDEKKPKQE